MAVELTGADEAGLHGAGVAALRALLVGASPIRERAERAVPIRGDDATERLVHFLQDVLYLFETERFVPARATGAGVTGESFNPERHETRPEVKAVTYHGAEVRPGADGRWQATVIFDV